MYISHTQKQKIRSVYTTEARSSPDLMVLGAGIFSIVKWVPMHSLLLSPTHRPNRTEILLKGRKIINHLFSQPFLIS